MLTRCLIPLSLSQFPRSLPPGFPCVPSRFLYLASLFGSFRPSLIRSHSRSSGACQTFPSGIFRFPSASFRPLLLRFQLLSLLFLPFRSFRFCLTVASPVPRSRFRSFGFLLLSCLISHAFLPDFRTWLSVGFLSSFPVSLPQLFHWCSPFSFPPAFVLCFAFFRPLCFRLLTTQLSALSFPFLPFSPGSGSFGAYLYPLPLCLLPYSGSALVLSFLFFVSPVSVFASQWLLFRSFALSCDFSVSP